MGESKIVRESRWVATGALILAVVGVVVALYGALLARNNHATILELQGTEAAAVIEAPKVETPPEPEEPEEPTEIG